MDRLITLFITMLFAGPVVGGGVFAFDRHAAVDLAIPIPIWRPHIHFGAGPIPAAEARTQLALANLAIQTANVGKLTAATKAQNIAVEALKADSDLRVAESGRAAWVARAVAASYRMQANAILAAKPDDSDDCKAASNLLTEAFR